MTAFGTTVRLRSTAPGEQLDVVACRLFDPFPAARSEPKAGSRFVGIAFAIENTGSVPWAGDVGRG